MNQQAAGQVKVIVVGDSGVGKSSLLLRFVNDQFNEFHEPTLGAAFLSKVHNYGNGKTTRFQVLFRFKAGVGYSRPGEIQVHSTHLLQRYYQSSINLESQVALCVYDITSKNSFHVMKNWVEELKSKGPADLLLSVVGNKLDKADDQQVPYNEVKQYAQSIGAIFKLTSAKEGKGINVLLVTILSQDLFTTIAERIEETKQRREARDTIQVKKGKEGETTKKGGCCGSK